VNETERIIYATTFAIALERGLREEAKYLSEISTDFPGEVAKVRRGIAESATREANNAIELHRQALSRPRTI